MEGGAPSRSHHWCHGIRRGAARDETRIHRQTPSSSPVRSFFHSLDSPLLLLPLTCCPPSSADPQRWKLVGRGGRRRRRVDLGRPDQQPRLLLLSTEALIFSFSRRDRSMAGSIRASPFPCRSLPRPHASGPVGSGMTRGDGMREGKVAAAPPSPPSSSATRGRRRHHLPPPPPPEGAATTVVEGVEGMRSLGRRL